MSKIRPYVALDLETTGLDTEKSQILQIGAIIDDGVSPIEELETFDIIVKNETLNYGEPYALSMNHWIFREYNNKETPYDIQFADIAIQKLARFLEKAAKMGEEWDIANNEKRPKKVTQLAGKNVGPFDFRILVNQSIALGINPRYVQAPTDHRFLDVGCMFFEEFGRNAGLNSINKLTGRTEVTHDALDDCYDVVYAIRHKAGGIK